MERQEPRESAAEDRDAAATCDAAAFAPPLVAELLAIPCPLRRLVVVREQLAKIGFRWLESVEQRRGRRDFRRVACWSALAPPATRDDASPGADPRLALALATPVPSVWDVDALEAVAPLDHTPPWLARLRAAQVRSGLSLAVRDDASTLRIVSLLATTPGRAWMGDAVAGRAALLAGYVGQIGDAAAVPDRAPTEHPQDALSDTQWSVLECLRQGLPDKLIADQLGMSTHNVDYHLRRLRQRFGVRNRVQLAQAVRGAM